MRLVQNAGSIQTHLDNPFQIQLTMYLIFFRFKCRLLHYRLFVLLRMYLSCQDFSGIESRGAWHAWVPGFYAKTAGKQRAETYTYVMLVHTQLRQTRMQQYLKHNMRRRRSPTPSGRWP